MNTKISLYLVFLIYLIGNSSVAFVQPKREPLKGYKEIEKYLEKNVKIVGDPTEIMKSRGDLLKAKLDVFEGELLANLQLILTLEDPSCSIETYQKVQEATFITRILMPPGGHLFRYMVHWRVKRASFCADLVERDYKDAIATLSHENYLRLQAFLSEEFILGFVKILTFGEMEPKEFIIDDQYHLNLTKIYRYQIKFNFANSRKIWLDIVKLVKEKWSELLSNKSQRFEILKRSVVRPCSELYEKLSPHFQKAQVDFKFESPLFGSGGINEYTLNLARVKLCSSIITKKSQDLFIEGTMAAFGGFW